MEGQLVIGWARPTVGKPNDLCQSNGPYSKPPRGGTGNLNHVVHANIERKESNAPEEFKTPVRIDASRVDRVTFIFELQDRHPHWW